MKYPFQINRIILSIDTLNQKSKGALKKNVINDLNKISFYATNPNFSDYISECVSLGLLRETGNRLYVTELGRKFSNLKTTLNGQIIIDLNDSQKKFLVELLFDNSIFAKKIDKVMKHVQFDFKNELWFLSENYLGKLDRDIQDLLVALNFFTLTNNRIEIQQENSYYVSKLRNKVTRSEEELFKVLESQRKIGNIAEELTLKEEKNRLIKQGFFELALSVQQISKSDVYAGYDILSFKGKNSGLSHDLMIEVKGTSGSHPYFYWSRNEIEKAKMLKENYWLYLWIEVKADFTGHLYRVIRNPYKQLFQIEQEKPDPVLFLVSVKP